MWKVLSDRLANKVHFGFIKDEKAEARGALGINSKDKKVDGVKVVTWTVEGEQNVYNGKLGLFFQILCLDLTIGLRMPNVKLGRSNLNPS